MASSSEIELLFLLDADEVAKNKHTVYIGSHGDRGATNADIVLPGACYTEKRFVYEYRGQIAGDKPSGLSTWRCPR